jgi:hypothetical protein
VNHNDLAVAAGIPCLRRAVTRPGRVLLYPAEDALHVVRRGSMASAPPPASASPNSMSR